jgi:hypothetical protein
MYWIALIVFAVMLPDILSSIFDSKMGRAMAARLERGGSAADPGVGERIRLLEGEVERLSEEVERLREAEEFLQRLLNERPLPERPRGGGEAPAALSPGERQG